MEVFKNIFLQIEYKSEENICIGNWTLKTEQASNVDFKVWNNELVKIIEKYKPSGFLANTLNYRFVISPDLQKWSVSNVFELFAKVGLKKIAMIVTDDLFPQVSLEQFIEEYEGGKIETKYFDKEVDSLKWLTK